jgi:predicted amidohydrolase
VSDETAEPELVRADGTYPTVELAKPRWRLVLVQSPVRGVEDAAGMAANLQHMLHLIDTACGYGPRPDLLAFHEFPISGWDRWNRAEALRFSIEIPGPEVEAIGERARSHGCYVSFGAYVRDADWPGHVLSVTTLVGPDGGVVARHWKARNAKGVFPGFELFTTTIYDVLEEYRERYGEDALVPVARTPLGNLMLSSSQLEPELFRAAALKGAEVFLRTATGGFSRVDVQASALFNRCYAALVNNAEIEPTSRFIEDGRSGGSLICGPDGSVLAEAPVKGTCVVAAEVDIAGLRARHRIPDIHVDLYRSLFASYQSRFAPGLYSAYQPSDLADAARYLSDKSRWA